MDAWDSSDFIGGKLCLDFANTLEEGATGKVKDHMPSVERFLGWLDFAKGLEQDETRWTLSSRITKKAVASTFPAVQRFRRQVYDVFHARAAGKQPPQKALSGIYATLARAILGVEPVTRARAGDKGREEAGEEVKILKPEGMLYPVAHSAAELLLDDSFCPIKECDAEHCHWIFLDSCKSRRRRWCDMKTCGNRAKARRHYRAQKECEQC